jgi:hypothetical protein
MHTDVLWYDTAGCYSGNHVDPFHSAMKPSVGEWHKDNKYPGGPYDPPSTDPASKFAPAVELADGTPWNRIDYSSDIQPATIGDIRSTQKDISIWLRRTWLEVADTCDLDCQARGSGMTIVATLNSIALSIIALNSIFMIIGAFKGRDRVCSVYFTIFACVFQFCVLMASAGLLFSPYARLCGYSTTAVGNFPGFTLVSGKDWMMMDDYWTMVGLWATQLVLMFAFCCCGMIPAYKVTTAGGTVSFDFDQ